MNILRGWPTEKALVFVMPKQRFVNAGLHSCTLCIVTPAVVGLDHQVARVELRNLNSQIVPLVFNWFAGIFSRSWNARAGPFSVVVGNLFPRPEEK